MSARPLIVLYDGWCSVCTKGAERLKPYERKHPDKLALRDLREHDELITQHNIDPKDARRTMHAITPDGHILTAMNAVRATARAAGKGWMIAWTALPGIRWITDKLYNWFARNRLRWFRTSDCPDGVCSID
jgi:predicted DCC family thiol-disulfide oxidoreductase YuxK